MGKGEGKGEGIGLTSMCDCCSEPFCKGRFPGITPCGRCYWTCTPCGVVSAVVLPIIGLIMCCVPNCEICGCYCNKVPPPVNTEVTKRR